MFFFYIFLCFFIVFKLIHSFIHITLYIYCDDYCIEMYLDNTLLNYNELNFDITIYNNFQKINFTANPGQKLTMKVQNVRRCFGIAAKFIIQTNGDYYIYDTKNNYDLFNFNIEEEKHTYSIACNTQYYSEICNELEFAICSEDCYKHDFQTIEYYFIIPNYLEHEILYANRDFEIIFVKNLKININDYFTPTLSIYDNYIGIYFSKYNNIDLKGKFYDTSSNEINLETINFDKKIEYSSPTDYNDMYNEILYYEFTHGEYFEEDNTKKTINLLSCPDYCSYCTIKKICVKDNGDINYI